MSTKKQAEQLAAVVRGMSPARPRTARIQWPSIAIVATVLRDLNDRLAHEVRTSRASGDAMPGRASAYADDGDDQPRLDVRLQVCPAGDRAGWRLWDGDPCYDTDHRGYWGSTVLDGRRMNARKLARELIEEAREHHAQSEGT